MKEKINSSKLDKINSYPVKVVAIRIDWVLNKDYGYKFFGALVKNKNLEYYDIIIIKVMIEYFYK